MRRLFGQWLYKRGNEIVKRNQKDTRPGHQINRYCG